MQIPILTYHSMNVLANSYADNDHLALISDLETIDRLGLRLVSLNRLVDWHPGLIDDDSIADSVAISFDDGSWFDYYDLDHPGCGKQRSMLNILRDFQHKTDRDRPVHATSFVISSPEARELLDQRCMIGKGWWDDQWWPQAAASGLLDIECHSWDHLHPLLDEVAQQDQLKGDFTQVKTQADASVQVTRAGEYIAEVLGGKRPRLFAYPWGQHNDYLTEDFLPDQQSIHRFRAAFTTEAKAVSKNDNIWLLPRFVCGRDWQSPQGLQDILGGAGLG